MPPSEDDLAQYKAERNAAESAAVVRKAALNGSAAAYDAVYEATKHLRTYQGWEPVSKVSTEERAANDARRHRP